MRLFNQIAAARRGDHLLVVDVDQARELSDRGTTAAHLIGMYDFWDIVFTQKPDQEDFRGFSVLVALKEGIERETVLVHCSPVGRRAHAVKRGQPCCPDQDARPFCPESASVGRHRRSYTPRPDATGNPVGVPGGAVLLQTVDQT